MKLLDEKTFEEITINELCEAADIRRATFYKHYSDKFAFLTAFTHTLRLKFDQTIWKNGSYSTDTEYYVAYARRIVGYISEHPAAVDNIVKSSLFSQMLSIILEQNYKDTKERLERSIKSGMRLYASVETLSAMCAGGIATAIYLWLVDGKKKSPEALAEEIGVIVHNLLG